jgi:predicted acylesterase/phospholipase RssA
MVTLFQWAFVRLPKSFTVPLLSIAAFYFLLALPFLVSVLFPLTLVLIFWGIFSLWGMTVGSTDSLSMPGMIFLLGVGVLVALVALSLLTVTLVLFGALLSHFLASKIYGLYRRMSARRGAAFVPPPPLLPASASETPLAQGSNNPLADFKRIGIILSGGGAKGAYQAGALQAIYEFLEENNAHGKVRMIAATSIGSWNALFWLAGLVKKNGDGTSPLERWWRQINLGNIVQPITYVPTRKNHFLSNDPWQRNFDALFGSKQKEGARTKAGDELMSCVAKGGSDEALHFYFTRSNIGKASLGYTTNRPQLAVAVAEQQQQFSIKGECYIAESLADIRDGVFASMDIPPLFQYLEDKEKKNCFEDGGVIDNLPISFGTAEECDLLFILPLNASFERGVDKRSVFRRLARVTEVRQGVLERNSFRMIYLYNQLASLTSRVSELEAFAQATPNGSDSGEASKREIDPGDDLKKRIERKTADMALKSTRQIVRVFSVCPASELKISTTEFWKTREAGEAFDFMYHATKNELKKFSQIVNSKYLRMIKISPASDSVGASAEAASQPGVDEDATSDVRPIRKVTDAVTYDVLYFKDF